ncbi:MAG: TIGR03936 family radical SAM-associated protein, partial [Candidatus Methylomirabilales bacterium]
EAVLSRGDRKLGRVLLKAHALGCRFDGWTERLNLDLWMKAFEEEGIDPGFYANRFIPLEEPLPWDHIHVVAKPFLLREWQRALNAHLTPECQTGPCRACGQVCLPNWKTWAEKVGAFGHRFDGGCQMSDVGREDRKAQVPLFDPPAPGTRHPAPDTSKQRIRFAFQKVGVLRFLSHLELHRALVRAMRRAGIPLAYSQGYHSKPRLAFALALPVGVEGVNELADVALAEPYAPEAFQELVNGELPPELQVLKAWEVPLLVPSLTSQVEGAVYRIFLSAFSLQPSAFSFSEEVCRRFLEKASIPVQVVGKERVAEVDARPYIMDFRPLFNGEGPGWELSLRVGKEGSIRPQAVFQRFLEESFNGSGRSPWFSLGQNASLEGLRIVRTTLLLRSSKISDQL